VENWPGYSLTPPQNQKMWNIFRAWTRTPLDYLGPLNDTIVDCKPVFDHKKWWKFDWPRVPAHQNWKCKISLERRNAHLSSLCVLQTTLKYIVNEPLMKENDGELMKIEYTLLLKLSMTDISRIWWCMPLISSGPKTDSKYLVINTYLVGNSTELTEIQYSLMVSIWHPLHVL